MQEKQIHLSNGDLLIRSEEGYYFKQDVGMSVPFLIDREEGERLVFETCSHLKGLLEKTLITGETKVKFLKEIDVKLQDESIDDERDTSFSLCECLKCHWKFIGECERHGYGFTSQGVQIPNFCPMCGSKIEDVTD